MRAIDTVRPEALLETLEPDLVDDCVSGGNKTQFRLKINPPEMGQAPILIRSILRHTASTVLQLGSESSQLGSGPHGVERLTSSGSLRGVESAAAAGQVLCLEMAHTCLPTALP